MKPAVKTALTVAGVGTGVAASGLAWGLTEANALFTLRRVAVPVLPSGSDPIRVLHLSDIHLMPYQHRKRSWLSTLAGLEPDLVVNTGDNISSPDSLDPLFDALGRLLDVPGVFVFGSNDYTAPVFRNPLVYFAGPSKASDKPRDELPHEQLRDRFTGAGWLDLNHHTGVLEVAGRRLAFRGTDDAHLQRDDYSLVAGPPDPDAVLNLGVTHAPYLRVLDDMVADGLDMVFAGHTHGGQVCIPFKGAIVTNCDIDPARVKGLSTHATDSPDGVEHTAWLHVSGGLGTSPFAPYRVACRPEATLLTLTAKP